MTPKGASAFKLACLMACVSGMFATESGGGFILALIAMVVSICFAVEVMDDFVEIDERRRRARERGRKR